MSYFTMYVVLYKYVVLYNSVSDPYQFDADPDPDPRIRFQDDGSGSGSGSGYGSGSGSDLKSNKFHVFFVVVILSLLFAYNKQNK